VVQSLFSVRTSTLRRPTVSAAVPLIRTGTLSPARPLGVCPPSSISWLCVSTVVGIVSVGGARSRVTVAVVLWVRAGVAQSRRFTLTMCCPSPAGVQGTSTSVLVSAPLAQL
jgi:hypothetical protein